MTNRNEINVYRRSDLATSGNPPSMPTIQLSGSRHTTARDVLMVVFRHKGLIAAVFCIVTLIAAGYAFAASDRYRSEAKLLLVLGHENVALDPTATTGQTVDVDQTTESQILSAIEMLKSRELAEQVARELGPAAILRADGDDALQHERAARTVLNNTNVEFNESDMINVTVDGRSPHQAREILSALLDRYLMMHIAVHQTPGSYEFFQQQAHQLRNTLETLEHELAERKNAIDVGTVADQRLSLYTQMTQIQSALNAVELELSAAHADHGVVMESIATIRSGFLIEEVLGLIAGGTDALRQELYRLRAQERDLGARLGPNSRDLKSIRRHIAATEDAIREEAILVLDTQRISLESIIDTLTARQRTLKTQLAAAQDELDTLNTAEAEVVRLEREIGIREANYRKYSENLEQARIDRELEMGRISNVRIVQPASFVSTPVGPNRPLILVGGAALAFLLALGMAFSAEYLDHSIKTPEEAEARLGLPVVTCIPRTPANRVAPSRSKSSGLAFWKKGTGKIEGWSMPRKVRDHYSTLAQRFLIASRDAPDQCPRIIAVTGCHRSNGVSTIAANLAFSLSRLRDLRVVLIDANVRQPTAHRIFHQHLGRGLIEALHDGDPSLNLEQCDRVDQLSVMSAGKRNGSDEIDVERFTELISKARDEYDFAIVDLPAVRDTGSSLQLASRCDGVLIVLEAERQRWEVPRRVYAELDRAGASVLGTVLNKRRYPIPQWLYDKL